MFLRQKNRIYECYWSSSYNLFPFSPLLFNVAPEWDTCDTEASHMESDLPLAVTSSFFSCCRTKLGFSVVSSQGKCFWFGKTPNDVVVFTYIAATVHRLSSINLKPAFSYSAVDSSCQLVFVPKRCVSWWLSDSLAVCSQRSDERFCESVCMLVTNFRNSFEYCFCFIVY